MIKTETVDSGEVKNEKRRVSSAWTVINTTVHKKGGLNKQYRLRLNYG